MSLGGHLNIKIQPFQLKIYRYKNKTVLRASYQYNFAILEMIDRFVDIPYSVIKHKHLSKYHNSPHGQSGRHFSDNI